MSWADRAGVAYLATRLPLAVVARAYGITPRCARRVVERERRRRPAGASA